MMQITRNLKILDKEKLLKIQQELEKKYGLRPHKRLRLDFIYSHLDNIPDELLTQESGGMYQ